MAVDVGTNAGFVNSQPTANPGGTSEAFGNESQAVRDTSPAGSNKVTEIGWFCGDIYHDAHEYQMAMYTNDATGGDHPNAVVPGTTIKTGQTAPAKAGGVVDNTWYRYTGLDWAIPSSSTKYWIACSCIYISIASGMDTDTDSGSRVWNRSSNPNLADPYTSGGAGTDDKNYAIYALYEANRWPNKTLKVWKNGEWGVVDTTGI